MKRGLGSPNMDPAKKRRICALGGKAAHQKGTAHEWTPDEARAAGFKGGRTSAAKRAAAKAVITNGIQGAFADALGGATGGKRACWPKQQHFSSESAEAQRRSLLDRGLAKNARRIHVYRCGECTRRCERPTWHVGHPG